MTVIGYTFEGGIYCEWCTKQRFGDLDAVMIDREGNVVHPIFGTDELSACGEGCSECGEWVYEPREHEPAGCQRGTDCRLYTPDVSDMEAEHVGSL